MKIRSDNGTILFANGTVSRDLTMRKFVASDLGQSAKETIVSQDRRHYDFDPEAGIGATIFFLGERVDRIFIVMSLPSAATREWTEELELRRKTIHNTWLESELGKPPYDFEWGRVTSEYDARSCSSEIIVVYER